MDNQTKARIFQKICMNSFQIWSLLVLKIQGPTHTHQNCTVLYVNRESSEEVRSSHQRSGFSVGIFWALILILTLTLTLIGPEDNAVAFGNRMLAVVS